MAHVPYANSVRSLIYATVCTQLDISHAMGVLRKYMETPGKEQWTTVKGVFRYLLDMTNVAICYDGNFEEVRVYGFIDSDWVGDIDGR